MICDRCLEDYPEGEYRKSRHFNTKVFCTPCEYEYETKLNIFNINFLNNQPERLSEMGSKE